MLLLSTIYADPVCYHSIQIAAIHQDEMRFAHFHNNIITWNRQTGERDMEGLNGQNAMYNLIKGKKTAMENENIEEQIRVKTKIVWSYGFLCYSIK